MFWPWFGFLKRKSHMRAVMDASKKMTVCLRPHGDCGAPGWTRLAVLTEVRVNEMIIPICSSCWQVKLQQPRERERPQDLTCWDDWQLAGRSQESFNSLGAFMGLDWIKLSSDQMESCFISKWVQILCEVMSKIEFSVAALHFDYYKILYHKNRNLIGRQHSSGSTCRWLFYNRFLAVHKKSLMFKF